MFALSKRLWALSLDLILFVIALKFALSLLGFPNRNVFLFEAAVVFLCVTCELNSCNERFFFFFLIWHLWLAVSSEQQKQENAVPRPQLREGGPLARRVL